MRYILLLAFQITLFYQAEGQSINSFFAAFSQDSLIKTVRELSGEDSVIINGTKTIIKNRAAYLGSNLTEDYLKARLAGYKITVQTQKYSINGLNIFGIQNGTKYPAEAYIIGAHHDAVTYYCADDNASGCAAILETARLLSGKGFEYTIIYTFWDEEEAGLWGSTYHAKQAKANGLSFRGIINIDMIGYDSNNDGKFDLHVVNDPSSLCLADSALKIISNYNLKLNPQIINPGSDRGDHYSYWKQGYLNTIAYGERIFTDDPNPAYHTQDDRIGIFNIPYFAELSKMTVGLMATLAKPTATGVSENHEFQATVKIFPNPTKEALTIELKNNLQAKVYISDISGRILFENELSQTVNTIYLNQLPNGIYLLTLAGKNERIIRKIVKTQ